MWPTGFFNVLSVLSFTLSCAAAFYVARCATVLRELQDKLTRSPVSRLQSLETSHAELVEEVQNLAHRVKMIKVRRAADHVRDDAPRSNDPDPHREPDRWREWMNAKLMRSRLPQ